MAIVYPRQKVDGVKLGLGFNYSYLNHRWGFDLGERFHLDPEYRVKTIMNVDRAVWEVFGKIGLGYENPAPRPSIEPYGHRFLPALYGCPCRYAPDSEPWAVHRIYSHDEIMNVPEWTTECFEQAAVTREIARQYQILRRKYGSFSSLQDLGSVINTAIYLRGDDLFVDYAERPEVVRKLYENITQATLLAIDYFQKLDGRPLTGKHIGNCTVAMISPQSYTACNLQSDRRLIDYCIARNIPMLVHQDSNVTAHLENYASFTQVKSFDFGQDTDFEKFARLRPDASVNCMWFPHYILTNSLAEIRKEAHRLMSIARKFASFSFTLYEIDSRMNDGLIFDFYDVFRKTD